MFSNLFSNWLFLAVIILTSALTILFVEHAGEMMRVAPLSAEKHASCIVTGATVLIIATIFKLTPAHWVDKLPMVIDENKAIDPKDPIMAQYLAQS